MRDKAIVAVLVLVALLLALEIIGEGLQWYDYCQQGGIGDGGAYCFHRGGNS